MQELAERLAECTTANGYIFDVADVSRRVLQALDTYPHGTVVLEPGRLERDEAWSGTAPWTRWNHEVALAIIVRPEAGDTTPLQAAVLQAVRDVVHAMNLPDSLGGLVDRADVVAADPFAPAEAFGGALVTVRLVYRTDERDLANPPGG